MAGLLWRGNTAVEIDTAPLRRCPLWLVLAILTGLALRPAYGDGPSPRLTLIEPPGGQAGASVVVQVSGSALDGLTGLLCDEPRIKASRQEDGRFAVELPAGVPPGLYDLRAIGANGVSSPRPFFVSPRPTVREADARPGGDAVQPVDLNVSLTGRVDPAGDVDSYRFRARAGQRIVIEGWAERLDSKLRAVLELVDGRGRPLASSRGYNGLDPRIVFAIPADGEYVVRLHDLTFTGSPEHVYRIDIDTGPRVDAVRPNVVERGKTTRVTFFGPNLSAGSPDPDLVDIDLTPPAEVYGAARTLERPARFHVDEFVADLPGLPSAVPVGVTDVSVVVDNDGNHETTKAQELPWPCEVSGRLEAGQEQDWYRLRVRRGEVVWLELFGERIGAPVDLDLSILDPSGNRELLRCSDSLNEPTAGAVSTGHTDPSCRWVAPADGDYRVVVRNVVGGAGRDPRRVYRLSVRREEADFRLLAVPAGGREPGGWNVPRGGRAWVEILASRRRGLSQPIRVTAHDLPEGFECPDVWLGPGVDRVPLVISAGPDASRAPAFLRLEGRADLGGVEISHEARVATVVSTDAPSSSARLTGRLVAASGPSANALLTATPVRTAVSQGSVVDVLVRLDVLAPGWKPGPVTLTGVGAPADQAGRVSPVPSETAQWWFSFQVPDRTEPGPYSLAVRAEAVLTAPAERPGAKPRTQTVTAYSNPLTIEVASGAIDLRVDPGAPTRIKRGEVVQLHYRALRRNGFIGKIHTELHAPEGVIGLRARGVTFVGQTETGELQIVASDDAPFGRQPTLRLDAVGTVEDEPIYHAGCFVDLEVTP
ncbi:MAG: PPC domain-containing protein [Isosphaeraceae bacterium]